LARKYAQLEVTGKQGKAISATALDWGGGYGRSIAKATAKRKFCNCRHNPPQPV
jgi:hypothetical protein